MIGFNDIAGRVTALEADRRKWAHETIGAVMADPSALVPVAIDAGLTVHTFGDEIDVRLIWSACAVCHSLGIGTVLTIAERSLRRGVLDRVGRLGPRGECDRAILDALRALADSYPVSVTAVRANVRELLNVAARVERIRTAQADLMEAVQDNPAKSPAVTINRPRFVLVESRGAA